MFVSAALPHTIFPPLFNRYEGGEPFGVHVDNAIRHPARRHRPHPQRPVGDAVPVRPEDYDGGELVIEDMYGPQSVKLPAGDLVLYPSKSLHRVTPVTRGGHGCRASSGSRAWSATTPTARPCSGSTSPSSGSAATRARDPAVLELTGVYHNLLRRWSEV